MKPLRLRVYKDKQNSMKVGDDYRTNPKSHQPGGVTVRVVFENGDFRDYDKIKSPEKYIAQVMKIGSDVVDAFVVE
tara:strand:+ start:429 stop:656 length:228 start_codon:yes stop_codon:yes gene_type:complete